MIHLQKCRYYAKLSNQTFYIHAVHTLSPIRRTAQRIKRSTRQPHRTETTYSVLEVLSRTKLKTSPLYTFRASCKPKFPPPQFATRLPIIPHHSPLNTSQLSLKSTTFLLPPPLMPCGQYATPGRRLLPVGQYAAPLRYVLSSPAPMLA